MGVLNLMKGVETMNVRKNIDYSEMYKELDMLMAKELPQMELYCGIGKAVCRRAEKGAAVMASEYLNKRYPDVKGFSPRSLRRMRDFYRTYENYPTLLPRAMKLGWIQNVVIMEADLTMDLREWYMKAAKQFGWSKTELISNIDINVHEGLIIIDDNDFRTEAVFDLGDERYFCERAKNIHSKKYKRSSRIDNIPVLLQKFRWRKPTKEKNLYMPNSLFQVYIHEWYVSSGAPPDVYKSM